VKHVQTNGTRTRSVGKTTANRKRGHNRSRNGAETINHLRDKRKSPRQNGESKRIPERSKKIPKSIRQFATLGEIMKENEATKYVLGWIDANKWCEEEFYFGLNNPRFRPDFMIERPRKMMIEVKGSEFSMAELAGQIVLYLLSFKRRKLIVAVPSRINELKELRKKLRRHSFNFEIIDVSNLKFFMKVSKIC
jgi:hypothetical protein